MGKIVLKDLLVFKNPSIGEQDNFRWPNLDDLQALKLKEPLKLTAIRARGEPNSYMTAIQLVFQNGIESPLFES